VALGFDSYLISLQKQRGSGLSGCYFCQDDSAPSNSLAYRTLDQQCTVSRPGVSAIASAYAVELLAACSQDAQPFVGETLVEPSLLGLIPNHIRGFMDTYKNTLDCVSESPTCVCCSPPILEAYEEPGFLEQVCLNSEILKQVSGLSALQSDICYDDVIQLD
jgi:ubiquitin-like modifier-activating enzyme ATG7